MEKKSHIQEWRDRQKQLQEEKKSKRTQFYKENQEHLAAEAKECMQQLRKDRKQKTPEGVKTHAKTSKQEKRKRCYAKRKQQSEIEGQEEEKKRVQTNERVKRFRSNFKSADSEAKDDNSEAGTCNTPAFTSRMSKKRSKDKVTPVLPKSPRKRAEIIESLASSGPRTRRLLERKGVLKSPEEQQNTLAMQCLVEDLAEGLSQESKNYGRMSSIWDITFSCFWQISQVTPPASTCCQTCWCKAQKNK